MSSNDSKGSVLIIDDFLPNLQLLTSILTESGYKVRGTPDGEAGLKAAQVSPPDIILLDIMLPGDNGYIICKKLKSVPETADIPVIFISALDSRLDVVKAFSVGGIDYITKPFQSDEVLSRVGTQLNVHRMRSNVEDLQQELLAANKALETSNQSAKRLKQERIALHQVIVKHLKNPLETILQHGTLLETGDLLLSEQNTSIQAIQQNARHMKKVLDKF